MLTRADAERIIISMVLCAETNLDQLIEAVDEASDGDLIDLVLLLTTRVRGLKTDQYRAEGERVDALRIRTGATLTILKDRLCGIAMDLGLDESPLLDLGGGNFGDDVTDRLLERMALRCHRRDGTTKPMDVEDVLELESCWNTLHKYEREASTAKAKKPKTVGQKAHPKRVVMIAGAGYEWALQNHSHLFDDDAEPINATELYELLHEEYEWPKTAPEGLKNPDNLTTAI